MSDALVFHARFGDVCVTSVDGRSYTATRDEFPDCAGTAERIGDAIAEMNRLISEKTNRRVS